MKKIYSLLITLFVVTQVFSQARVIEWSIGTPVVSCTDSVVVCYPLMASINVTDSTPELSTSTMRIFFDAGLLSNLQIQNLEASYSASGLDVSNDVYGTVFGFTAGGGRFAQFNILAADPADLVQLTSTPAHILDFCFTLDTASGSPFCASIVFDNNHCGWGMGIAEDDGYLMNDAGIVGTYILLGDATDNMLADDEVINFLWDTLPGFDCTVDMLSDITGQSTSTDCIEVPCLLPVEYLSFKAIKEENAVNLTWVTSTEINNNFFDVERSFDGKNFRSIGKIEGNGTTFSTSSYAFTDKSPQEANYYRLRQVDFDGTMSYSNIRFVSFDNEDQSKLEVFPNPFVNEITIDLGSAGLYQIELFNASGKSVVKQSYNAGQSVDLTNIPSGSYTLKVHDLAGNEILVKTIVKTSRS